MRFKEMILMYVCMCPRFSCALKVLARVAMSVSRYTYIYRYVHAYATEIAQVVFVYVCNLLVLFLYRHSNYVLAIKILTLKVLTLTNIVQLSKCSNMYVPILAIM
jgi:hypothetical protein